MSRHPGGCVLQGVDRSACAPANLSAIEVDAAIGHFLRAGKRLAKAEMTLSYVGSPNSPDRRALRLHPTERRDGAPNSRTREGRWLSARCGSAGRSRMA